MIAVGQRVRHRKQAAWGRGVVTQVTKVGALVELAIDFEGGERRLKLKPELVETMIEVLSAEENAAIDAELAAEARAADAAARARRKDMKASKHAPRAKLPLNCLALLATGDGHVVLSVNDGERSLRVVARDGAVVEERGSSSFVATDLITDGHGLYVGTRTHEWGVLELFRRGQDVRMWRAPMNLGVPRVTARPDGVVIHDLERVVLAREDGSAHEVPVALDGRTVGEAVIWGDGVLVGTHGKNDEDYFRYRYLGLDGSLRHEGTGGYPWPLGDDQMITIDPRGVFGRDRAGTVTGRLDRSVYSGSLDRKLISFLELDDELVFSTRDDTSGLVRWHPRVDEPRWHTVLSHDASLTAPVRVGPYVAVSISEYSDHPAPKVWIVDAETGAVVHVLDLKKPPTALVPVGDDALVAVSYSKQPVAFRRLSSAKPERLLLTHATECFSAASPAPGVVITTDHDSISFFEL
ncbi:MAG TPA: hypothetical protein VFQ53_36800 [Kofleriaceae bacterium]|nr:hypothetical protein [Kofleriaceae bacterium]